MHKPVATAHTLRTVPSGSLGDAQTNLSGSGSYGRSRSPVDAIVSSKWLAMPGDGSRIIILRHASSNVPAFAEPAQIANATASDFLTAQICAS